MNEPFDQINPESTPPPPPKVPLGKVLGINFGIMIAGMLIFSSIISNGREAGLGMAILNAFLILALVGFNTLIGFAFVLSDKRKQLGGAMLISALVIGIVGFGTCLSHVSSLGGIR